MTQTNYSIKADLRLKHVSNRAISMFLIYSTDCTDVYVGTCEACTGVYISSV